MPSNGLVPPGLGRHPEPETADGPEVRRPDTDVRPEGDELAIGDQETADQGDLLLPVSGSVLARSEVVGVSALDLGCVLGGNVEHAHDGDEGQAEDQRCHERCLTAISREEGRGRLCAHGFSSSSSFSPEALVFRDRLGFGRNISEAGDPLI